MQRISKLLLKFVKKDYFEINAKVYWHINHIELKWFYKIKFWKIQFRIYGVSSMEIYDISVKDINGENVSLEIYRGKVLLIVNTASKCGFTKQFDGLEELYEKYKDEGFEVLGFPCNQFKEQDPGSNSEIMNFCKLNFGVTFPMFEKIDVNGENESLLYSYLKEQKSGMFGSKIKWNFTKFLVDREGNVIKRFSPQTTPKSIEKDIEELLA